MKKIFSILTIVGLILGIGIGIGLRLLPADAALDSGAVLRVLDFIGTWYVKILKIFIGPVIFTGIACTVCETARKKNGLIWKSVLLFTVMFIATFLLTSGIVSLLQPGKGYSFTDTVWDGQVEKITFMSVLTKLLPQSWEEIFLDPKVFPIIVLAWVFGKIMSLVKRGNHAVYKFFSKLKELIFLLLGFFLYTTPVAVCALISVTVYTKGDILLGLGLKYIGVALLCSVVTLIVVMILPVVFLAKMSPWTYIRKACKIWIVTLTTCSSAATLPYTVKLMKEELGVSAEVTDVVVPLGCTIHMCGGAVSFALLGLFCAELYSVPVTFGLFLLMIGAALLINMAAPGVPGGGIVIGAGFLQLLGIPLDFIGFYSGIYKFLDMQYTTLNVTGDITAGILLNKFKRR